MLHNSPHSVAHCAMHSLPLESHKIGSNATQTAHMKFHRTTMTIILMPIKLGLVGLPPPELLFYCCVTIVSSNHGWELDFLCWLVVMLMRLMVVSKWLEDTLMRLMMVSKLASGLAYSYARVGYIWCHSSSDDKHDHFNCEINFWITMILMAKASKSCVVEWWRW